MCARRVDPSALGFSLSSHRKSHVFSLTVALTIQNKTTPNNGWRPIDFYSCRFVYTVFHTSLVCVYWQSKRLVNNPIPTENHTVYSVVGRNTNWSQTESRVPHGSRPDGHDRSLVLCVNDPTTPILSPPLVYSSTVRVMGRWGHLSIPVMTWYLGKTWG